MSDPKALRVAVVGSGPAGMYATAHLLGSPGGTWLDGRMVHLMQQPVEVDVFERQPTPWGLIRSGVAPDHPERKRIADTFERLANHERFRFFGNICVGQNISVAELSRSYDAIILAHGAAGDRLIGIPGENLTGSASARSFVAWYNGNPEARDFNFDLSTQRAVVVGNGNVALDVARILLSAPDSLASTDIADHALQALRASSVREVVLVGRRGPLHAAFGAAELEEIADLPDVDIIVDPTDLPSKESAIAQGADASALRKIELLTTYAQRPARQYARKLHLKFFSTPIEILGEARVQGLRLGYLQNGAPTESTAAAESTIEAGLVLRAVGYRGLKIDGLPFDEARGTVPNQDGRVLSQGQAMPGVYVTGWAKRGPSGIVGTNRKCARDAVRALASDVAHGIVGRPDLPDRGEIAALLARRQPQLVTRQGWQAIDAAERAAGTTTGRPRVKLTSIDSLLGVAHGERANPIPGGLGGSRRYDAIVVGSGLGGLSTAACLSAVGKSVLLLEQHEILGGCSQTFRRKGKWEFDCGVHYVGGCEPGSDGMISTVLRGLGVEDRIKWSRLDDSGMDTVMFPDHSFRVPTNWEGLASNLRAAYPKDADGLTKAIKELRYIGEGGDRINDVPHSVGVLAPLLKRPLEALAIARGLEFPIGHLFDRCKLSQEARGALLALVHLHNTPPARTPALLVALLLQHYFRAGAYFPVQGGQVIAANLAEVIRSHGGVIRTKTLVRSIDVESGRVRGVTLSDGERISADVVVSNADVHRTFQNLIHPSHLSQRTIERIRAYRRPHSIFSMYIGADIDISKTRPATNYILHDRYDIQATYDLLDKGQWDPKGWLAISSPTLKTWGERHYGPPDHSSIELFASAPADYEFWGGGDPKAGTDYKFSEIYQERKAEFESVLLERTLKVLPELRGHVAWQESATPLTHERFTLSRMPYGPENAKDQIGPFRRLPVTTEIAGLFLAGASTAYLFGVAFTLRGGVGTASHIIGRDLLREFQKGVVISDRNALPEHGPHWDPFQASRGYSSGGPRGDDLLGHAA
ncbi:FAD-dependent oxidoreductase [Solimonas sp. K1W22B-7]|uniref:FAD-dependent oxidoreductase n=1 Tax=Solimonas sp. K1W22B-7 TaxID=2303331 RepID=UPI000E330FC8|nr:FAD-dependent oxidoreductase [Solimonas sp. K1W22B-7]AXQ31077.1 FAD-dependent oxidoreductase [Solimonas sp. K1W22B-7]